MRARSGEQKPGLAVSRYPSLWMVTSKKISSYRANLIWKYSTTTWAEAQKLKNPVNNQLNLLPNEFRGTS